MLVCNTFSSNLYKETIASGVPNVLNPGLEGAGIIRQGTLEASNVNVVEEMVNMIETQRAYEVNSKSISANRWNASILEQQLIIWVIKKKMRNINGILL